MTARSRTSDTNASEWQSTFVGPSPELRRTSSTPFRLNRQSAIGNRQFTSGFTLVELLATLFILSVIVTITGVLLKETRFTAKRLAENESASHTAERALELIRRDLEHAIADSRYSNFVFVATNADVDTSAVWSTDFAPGSGTNGSLIPSSSNSTRACMLVLNDSSDGGTSTRSISEVFYWLASTPTSACATLVRAEIRLDTFSDPGAYTNPVWYETNCTDYAIVARYVTDFTLRCTGRDGNVSNDWVANELPASIDVGITYLPESAARRLHAQNAMTNRVEVANSVTRISGRVFLPNRRGYMDGK